MPRHQNTKSDRMGLRARPDVSIPRADVGGTLAGARTAPGIQRLVALVLLLGAGILSLPMAALALDGEGTENLILPAQLGGMVVVGAVVGYVLPGLAGATASKGRSARVGALVGLALAVVGIVFFFLLLSGFDGA
jgi:hypothetical protein